MFLAGFNSLLPPCVVYCDAGLEKIVEWSGANYSVKGVDDCREFGCLSSRNWLDLRLFEFTIVTNQAVTT